LNSFNTSKLIYTMGKKEGKTEKKEKTPKKGGKRECVHKKGPEKKVVRISDPGREVFNKKNKYPTSGKHVTLWHSVGSFQIRTHQSGEEGW